MKKKPNGRKRSEQLLIRLTKGEIAQIRSAAKRVDFPVSMWVRRVLIDVAERGMQK